jgi:hypothetical protein
MIRLDVRDHRHRRREGEEGAVVLIRLHHEETVATGAKVPLPRRDATACQSRRGVAGGRQRFRRHDRRRGLAVRSGHGHELGAGDRLA